MKPLSLVRNRFPAWQLKIQKICHKYRTQIHLAFGVVLAFFLNMPTAAQAQSCVGFMCGAKNGLLEDAVIAESDFMTKAINFLFVAGNAFLAVVLLLGFVYVLAKVIERENYMTPGMVFVVIIFGIVIVNWATGYLFGDNGATATSGTGTVPTVPAAGQTFNGGN